MKRLCAIALVLATVVVPLGQAAGGPLGKALEAEKGPDITGTWTARVQDRTVEMVLRKNGTMSFAGTEGHYTCIPGQMVVTFAKETGIYGLKVEGGTLSLTGDDLGGTLQFSRTKSAPAKKAGPVPSPVPSPVPKPAPASVTGSFPKDFSMANFTATDKSFSLCYPSGWTVQSGQGGMVIAQDPKDAGTTAIEIMPLAFPEPLTSKQLMDTVAEEMLKESPSLKIIKNKLLSKTPDIRAVSATYEKNNAGVCCFAVAACHGKQALWADIYGTPESFRGYNPVGLLIYILQSLSQGTKPNVPQMKLASLAVKQQPGETAADGTARKKFDEAAFMTHYWDMAPYTLPDVFTTIPLW